MKEKIRVDNEDWARCGRCGHKLFKIKAESNERETQIATSILKIEIKCHSCKSINILEGGE